MEYKLILKELEENYGWTGTKEFTEMQKELINDVAKIISNQVDKPVSDDFAELYWKHRCEAAESFISESPCDPDITEKQIKAYAYWKKLYNIKPEDYNK